MNTEIKNRVNFKQLFFWKSFLQVFFMFFVIKLILKLIEVRMIGAEMTFGFYLNLFSVTFFSSLVLGLVFSFVITYFIVKRLINENPKKVFTVGFVKLCLGLLIFQLIVLLASFLAGGELVIGVAFMLMYFSMPIPILFIWIYLSTFWLYRYSKKVAATNNFSVLQ